MKHIILWVKGYRYVQGERKNRCEIQSPPVVLYTEQHPNDYVFGRNRSILPYWSSVLPGRKRINIWIKMEDAHGDSEHSQLFLLEACTGVGLSFNYSNRQHFFLGLAISEQQHIAQNETRPRRTKYRNCTRAFCKVVPFFFFFFFKWFQFFITSWRGIEKKCPHSTETNVSKGKRQSRSVANLQISVMVLTEQLQEAQDWLHDGDDDAHLAFLLALICCGDRGALSSCLVLFGFHLPFVGGEGFLCDSRSFH